MSMIRLIFISLISVALFASDEDIASLDTFEILDSNINDKYIDNKVETTPIMTSSKEIAFTDENIEENNQINTNDTIPHQETVTQEVVAKAPQPQTKEAKTVKEEPTTSSFVQESEPRQIVDDTPKSGLNLRDAIIKAVSRNKKILSLREKVIQAKRVVDQKKAELYPSILLTGSSSKNINSEEGKDEKDNFFKEEKQITITENLYAGGKTTNSIKMAKAALKSAIYKYQQNLEKEILNSINAYLSVIYEKKSITTNRENIVTLNKILNIVTLKEKNGAATKGDLNYIKSNIENTRSELVLAESKYKNAISYYEYFVGSIDNGNYPIEDDIKVSINPNADIKKLVAKNPQLKEIEANIAN